MAIICRDRKLLFIMVPSTGCSSIGEILIPRFGGEYLPKKDVYQNGQRILESKHNSIKELVTFEAISPIELPIYFKFATVRNPFDRLASEYQKALQDDLIDKRIYWERTKLPVNASPEEQTYLQELEKKLKQQREQVKKVGFETWLEHRIGAHKKVSFLDKTRFYLKSLSDPYHMPKAYSPLIGGVDEVIRFEHLEEDFNALLKRLGLIKRHEHIAIPNVNPTTGKKPYQEYYSQEARKLVEKHLARELAVFGYKFD